MQSPFSFGKVVLFLLINIIVSALTTWVVVRVLVPPIGQASSILGIVAPAPPTPAAEIPASAPPESGAISSTPADGATASAGLEATPTLLDIGGATPPAAPPTPLDATAAATGINVRISTIIYPGQLSRERVVIVNEGEQVELEGWKIVSPRGESYTFGRVTLFQNGFINLNSTTGSDVPSDLFWGAGAAVWQSGDEVKLIGKNDTTIATFTVK
jgi:competence protein ComEC